MEQSISARLLNCDAKASKEEQAKTGQCDLTITHNAARRS